MTERGGHEGEGRRPLANPAIIKTLSWREAEDKRGLPPKDLAPHTFSCRPPRLGWESSLQPILELCSPANYQLQQ